MFKNLNAAALGVSGHESEIIELALTYGFQGIDVDIVEIAGRADLHGMPYARRLIESASKRTGFRIGTFPLPLDWDTDDEVYKPQLEKLSKYAEVAAELGCTRCIATIPPAGDKRPYHENFEFHRHRFNDISQVLQPHGVRLGLGFRAAEGLRQGQAFQFVHDLDALSLLIKMVGDPNVGILLDVWDVYVSGGTADALRGLSAEQIVAVQLADVPLECPPVAEMTEEMRTLPQSEGGPDLASYVIVLAELGYDGPVTLKPHRNALGGRRRDAIVQAAGGALDRLWRTAGLTPEGKLAAPAGS
ncbi:MAG: sugar phosphate isomerase/epimerase family protein [Planctomycetota bacterium]|jgi:sugar phosphate isomerase/epimerase